MAKLKFLPVSNYIDKCCLKYDEAAEWLAQYMYSLLDALPSSDIGDKGNNKITELRTILQRESQNS